MGRSIMDAFLGGRPPGKTELIRMTAGQQMSQQMFGKEYKPLSGATVYTNQALMDEYKEAAINSGMVMDQLEVIRYTQDNFHELSRRSMMILASMPSAKFSGLLDYKLQANGVTPTEIKYHSHYHCGIDYGEGKSFSVHVDQDEVEVASEEERLAIAYNEQLMSLIIECELDEDVIPEDS